MLAASIILAIMIMPFIMSVAREVLLAVPQQSARGAAGAGSDAVGSGRLRPSSPTPGPGSSGPSSSAWGGRWGDDGGHHADRKPA
mgnify:CR=1 FL=1